MAEVDFVEQIHIAQFWRKHLGEYEYVYHNPDDLLRWYIALETRGPEEIRAYLNERTGRFPMPVVTGIVATAPHPPRAIVELWLSTHDKFHSSTYWWALAAFFVFSVVAAPNLQGCTQLHDLNTLATNPPRMQAPIEAAPAASPPGSASTLPNPGPPPASVASPTATPSAVTISASHQ